MPGADTPGRHRLPYAGLDQRSVGRGVASLRDQDVVEPLPTITHQQAARRVANVIEQALPDLLVVEAVAVRLAPDVEDVQVVGVPDEKYGEELCAWIRIRSGRPPLDADAVRAYATGKLAHYKIPRYVMVVDEFPMTVTGKIRKVQMREESARSLGLD